MPGDGRSWWRRARSRVVGIVVVAGTLAAGLASSADRSAAKHWAFEPLAVPASTVPSSQGVSFIDRFLESKLRETAIAPNRPIGQSALLRRASFDLTGLPPTPDEMRLFREDRSTDAFERLIERLLRSPRYGERWGRHWMDVVRYADTAGDNADFPIPEIYRYRDYVIDSFNRDLPFDQFAQEQLAGDLLGKERPLRRTEGIVATGFLALSRRYGTGPYELWHLTLENTIETVGQAFLGLNLKCARCHDHKFDPLTMRDYYGLYGIFSSTEFPWAGSEEVATKNLNREKFVPLEPKSEPAWKDWEARLSALRSAIAALEKEKPENQARTEERDRNLATLKRELRNLEKPGAPPGVAVAYAVGEGKPADAALQRRGEPSDAGPAVPRCAPEVLSGPDSLRIAPGSSGRLEFARWLTGPAQALTARVMVNRIWQHHFGQGLVRTPNNLGVRGDPPVHRELLDELARRFIESGWSIKAMHRLIMNSAAYRRASDGSLANQALDPENRLFWRFDRQRLDAESIRDAMLFASGELDLDRPGAHAFPPPDKWGWTQHNPFKERYDTKHRSVYLMTQRLQRHPFLALFDGPDTNNSTESRRSSTVPQQALFSMNNPFIDEQATALAQRVLANERTTENRLTLIYKLAWSRAPESDEAERSLGWLKEGARLANESGADASQSEVLAWSTLARVMLTANEFFYVD